MGFSTNTLGIAAAILLTTGVPAAAQLIYTNGVPDNQAGLAVYPGTRSANDFPLLSTTQLGSFDWYVLLPVTNGPSTISNSFTWWLYDNAAGIPGTAVASATVTATANKTPFYCCGITSEFEAYIFTNVSFGGLALGPGQYWLAIGDFSEYNTYWASSSGSAGNEKNSFDGGTTWYTYSQEGAFSIYGPETTVPEPGSLALLAIGLVGLAPTFRRKLRL